MREHAVAERGRALMSPTAWRDLTKYVNDCKRHVEPVLTAAMDRELSPGMAKGLVKLLDKYFPPEAKWPGNGRIWPEEVTVAKMRATIARLNTEATLRKMDDATYYAALTARQKATLADLGIRLPRR